MSRDDGDAHRLMKIKSIPWSMSRRSDYQKLRPAHAAAASNEDEASLRRGKELYEALEAVERLEGAQGRERVLMEMVSACEAQTHARIPPREHKACDYCSFLSYHYASPDRKERLT